MQKNSNSESGLIVIDGVDGAGKGEQTRRLHSAMLARGYNVILTREPGGSDGAEEIRGLIVEGEPGRWDTMTELLLIYAARRAHLRDTVWPALATGRWVISDRFADSSRAFQGYASDLGIRCVEEIHQIVVGDFAPVLTLILDIDPAIALQRAVHRGGNEDRFERKGLAFQQSVREGFQKVAQNSAKHELIDASGPMNEVSTKLFAAINKHLGIELSLR